MSVYLLYYSEVEVNGNIRNEYKDIFTADSENIKDNIIRIATNNIRKMEGLHADNAYGENRKYDDILNNEEYKDGQYILYEDEKLNLYEKKHIISKGYFYNSMHLELNKKGTYNVIELKLDEVIKNIDIMNKLMERMVKLNIDNKLGQLVPLMNHTINIISNTEDGNVYLERIKRIVNDEIDYKRKRVKDTEKTTKNNSYIIELEKFIQNPKFKKTGIHLE